MAESTYTAPATYTITFPSLSQSEVKVSIDGVLQSSGFTISGYATSGSGTVAFTSAPTAGSTVRIFRDTTILSNQLPAPKSDFQPGASIKAEDLNVNMDQVLYKLAEKIDDGDISNDAVVTQAIRDLNVTTDKIANSNVTTAKIADSNVTTAKIAADAVNGTRIADNSINSEHYVDGSIDTTHIADVQVTTAKIADDAVTPAKLANTAVTAGSYTAADITVDAQGRVTAASNGAIGTSEITDAAVTTAKIADANVTTAKVADSAVTTAKIANDAVTVDKINDGEITVAKLNASAVVLNSEQIGSTPNDTSFFTTSASDGRYFRQDSTETITSGVPWSSNDLKAATTGAIDARIIDLMEEVGGFVPIANETSFPALNPDVNNGTGTIVSVSAIGTSRTPSSGTVTIANGAGSGNTVTITGLGSQVLTAGFGMLVETTSTLHTYSFHRLTAPATNVNTCATNISSINSVATDIANVNAAASNANNINTTATNITNVNTVGTNIANVNTAAGSIANINTIANDLNEATSEIDTVATNIVNVNNVGNNIANVNAAAANLSSINNFADVYRVSSSDPSTSLNTGDLVFNTSNNALRVYNGSAWQDGVTATGNFMSKSGDEMTGDLTIPDKIIHSGDTNTAIRFPANDTVSVETAGSERLRIDSSGKLGLGTSSPSVTYGNGLHIAGVNAGLKLQNNSDGGWGYIEYADESNTTKFIQGYRDASGLYAIRPGTSLNATSGLSLDSSGRLLVGTTTVGHSDADNLTIADSSKAGITIRNTTTTGDGAIFFSDATSGTAEYAGYIEYGHSTNHLRFATSSVERMRIDSSGRVGIGTSSPAVGFDLNTGDANASIRIRGTSDSPLNMDATDSGPNYVAVRRAGTRVAYYGFGGSGDNFNIVNETSTGSVTLSTNSTERLRIDSSGKLGLGTSSPSNMLHINGASPAIRLSDTGANGSAFSMIEDDNGLLKFRNDSGNSGTGSGITFDVDGSEKLRLDSSGRLGLGTSSPDVLLELKAAEPYIQFTDTAASSGYSRIMGTANNALIIGADEANNVSGSYVAFNVDSTERVRIDASGNVGIGTASPSGRLTIKDGGYRQGIVLERAASTTDRGFIYIGDGTNSTVADEIYLDANNTAFHFRQGATGTTETVTFKADGKVGIGTASPSQQLDVVGSNAAVRVSEPGGAELRVAAGGSTGFFGTYSNDPLQIVTNSQNALRIDTSGRLLVGTTSDTTGDTGAKIQIVDSGTPVLALSRNDTSIVTNNTIGQIRIFSNDDSGYQECARIAAQADGTFANNDKPTRLVFSTTADGASSPTERMRITSAGFVRVDNGGNPGTASQHIFRSNDQSNEVLIASSTNASYNNSTGGILHAIAVRSASSAYSFGGYYSGNGTDREFNFRGDGNGYCDGSWNGGGADYAEYFEWSDGNPDAEDRRGISVVLVGDKIRPAITGEDPIGVISGNPSVVGDAAWNKWSGKYLRDDYGTYIQEDYEVEDEDGNNVIQQRRKLNPAYDQNVEYTSREERPEWDCVGLMGKLRIRKGQVTGSRWIKMRDVSDTVEEWLVR